MSAAKTQAEEAVLALTVRDEAGRPLPYRAEFFPASGPARSFWRDGAPARLACPAGQARVLLSRGLDYDAVALELAAAPGATLERAVTLRRRFDARALGWHSGENHAHVIHGHSDDPALTIAAGARVAAADGLDYVQFAWKWERTGAWLPAAELERQCRAASTPDLAVGWNIETPKSYMSKDDGGRSGNLHCYGHGWSVGLKDNSRGFEFFHSGPNFRVLQEIHRQGGIAGCAHPVRYWFNRGNFVSNWPSELPFDFVAGVPYDAVDILNDSPLLFFESERFWYALLNLGYKLAGTGNSDACLEHLSGLGRFRTYTHIEGAFSWEKLAAAMQAGRNVATSGPFALFDVDGAGPGAEFPADGRVRRARLRAWSGPYPGETLTAVQLVRNGEVVRAWDLSAENAREWETEFELRASGFAWYAVRVLSAARHPTTVALHGPHAQELAAPNPVWFLPEGFERPRPEPARVTLAVTDAATGRALRARVTVSDGGPPLDCLDHKANEASPLVLPATASLRVEAPGYRPEERNLFRDCPELFEYCRNLGAAWPSFFSPEPYLELRKRLGSLKLAVALNPE